MLARNEQNVAKALSRQRARLATHFIHRERHAQNGVVAREAAILAVVDALVGKVERREEPDDFAEALLGDLLGARLADLFFYNRVLLGFNKKSIFYNPIKSGFMVYSYWDVEFIFGEGCYVSETIRSQFQLRLCLVIMSDINDDSNINGAQ